MYTPREWCGSPPTRETWGPTRSNRQRCSPELGDWVSSQLENFISVPSWGSPRSAGRTEHLGFPHIRTPGSKAQSWTPSSRYQHGTLDPETLSSSTGRPLREGTRLPYLFIQHGANLLNPSACPINTLDWGMMVFVSPPSQELLQWHPLGHGGAPQETYWKNV